MIGVVALVEEVVARLPLRIASWPYLRGVACFVLIMFVFQKRFERKLDRDRAKTDASA